MAGKDDKAGKGGAAKPAAAGGGKAPAPAGKGAPAGKKK